MSAHVGAKFQRVSELSRIPAMIQDAFMLVIPCSPKEFAGKSVLVGVSYTGCGITIDLTSVAKKVYISHRSRTRIVSAIPYFVLLAD